MSLASDYVRLFTVGFCFGGSNSWYQAENGHGLAGAIGFYGHPARPSRDGGPSVIDRIDEIECPILALMAGADQGITPDIVQQFREALQRAGKEHEIIVYPGAPHSFFDRTYEQHADAAADAWQRVLGFMRKNSIASAGAR